MSRAEYDEALTQWLADLLLAEWMRQERITEATIADNDPRMTARYETDERREDQS
jgi:hypothetical protein